MNEIGVDVEVVRETLGRVRALGEGIGVGRVVPSIAMCGSDEVIDAFVQAYRMVDQQESGVLQGWADLARRASDGLAELARVDAELAGASA